MALNINNINNKSSSIKDQVAKQLNDKASDAANAAKTVEDVNINTKPVVEVEETDNSNLRENIKSLNQKTKDASDSTTSTTDMSKLQVGFPLGKDKTTKNIDKAQKAVKEANEAIDAAEKDGSAISKYKVAKKIDKAEAASNKFFNDLGFTKDENDKWSFAPTAIPEEEPKRNKKITELANNVILIYNSAKSISEEQLKSVKEKLLPFMEDGGSLSGSVKDVIKEKDIDAYNFLYGDSKDSKQNQKAQATAVTPKTTPKSEKQEAKRKQQEAKKKSEQKSEKEQELKRLKALALAKSKAAEAAAKEAEAAETADAAEKATDEAEKKRLLQEAKRKQQEAKAAAEAAKKASEEAGVTDETKTETKLDEALKNYTEYGQKATADAFDSYDEMLAYSDAMMNLNTKEFEKKLKDREDAARLSDFLPRFAISRYLNNEFGDISKDKDGKPKNPESKKQADRTLAYFILDKIGTGLINSSAMMNGLTPTQKTALQKYNETQMDNALKRDDETRARAIREGFNNDIKNNDTLRQFGVDRVDIGKGLLTKTYEYFLSSVNKIQAIKELEAFIESYKDANLSDEDIATISQVKYLLNSDADETTKALSKILESNIEGKYAKTKQEKEEAEYKAQYYKLMSSFTDEKVNLEMEKLRNENKLQEADVAKAVEEIKKLQTENKYKNASEIIKLVSDSTGIASNVVGSIGSIFKLF